MTRHLAANAATTASFEGPDNTSLLVTRNITADSEFSRYWEFTSHYCDYVSAFYPQISKIPHLSRVVINVNEKDEQDFNELEFKYF